MSNASKPKGRKCESCEGSGKEPMPRGYERVYSFPCLVCFGRGKQPTREYGEYGRHVGYPALRRG